MNFTNYKDIFIASIRFVFWLNLLRRIIHKRPKEALKEEPKVKCFFTTPSSIRNRSIVEVVPYKLDPIVDFIFSAQESLDICVYIINSRQIIHALVEAQKRNVTVRLITDFRASIEDNQIICRLYEAGVQVYGVKTDYIMHNKFIILDMKKVLLTTANFTRGAGSGDYNSIVIIANPKDALEFQGYFEVLLEIWKGQNQQSRAIL